MEQKTHALKISSKVIAVIMNIGSVAMLVMMCACAAALIFMAATGGRTSIVTAGGTTISIAEGLSLTPAGFVAVCVNYLVMGGFLYAIFLLAHRMFGQISKTGDPFTEKYGKIIRAIGILVAAMAVVTGIAEWLLSLFAAAKGVETYAEAPGVVIGALIFCLSYIIDYGCALKPQHDD